MLLEKGPLDQGREVCHRSFLNELIPELDSTGTRSQLGRGERKCFPCRNKEQQETQMPGGRGCGLSEERAGGRCRASHQGTGWLATFDKLALRRAASFVYKSTDSKQCSSALNLRPGKA